jgi:predicted SprT family Zn-dependent metalloprotease
MNDSNTPTGQTYGTFEDAFRHFNATLFGGVLPSCLITVQRQRGAYGYFSGDRFGRVGGSETVDEIAMNPAHFDSRPIRVILSTLAHEMAHLWQHRYGKPSRKAYHNREWAQKMREIGLVPFNIDDPRKDTGQKVSHTIQEGGPFDLACAAWLKENPAPLYHDRAGEDQSAKKNRNTRTKYRCPHCEAAAWGKPTLNLICGDCEARMEAESEGGA